MDKNQETVRVIQVTVTRATRCLSFQRPIARVTVT